MLLLRSMTPTRGRTSYRGNRRLMPADLQHLTISRSRTIDERLSIEGDEFRHYLARLARRSCCISRCEHALRRAVKLYVFAYNRRQLHMRRFPQYPAPPMHFA